MVGQKDGKNKMGTQQAKGFPKEVTFLEDQIKETQIHKAGQRNLRTPPSGD